MANLVITSSETLIMSDNGIYTGVSGPLGIIQKKVSFGKEAIARITLEPSDTYVELTFRSSNAFLLISYTTTSGALTVDSINGVAPVSNTDLYNKLVEILDFYPSAYNSSALEASAIVLASPGRLYGITGHNNKNTDQFIQIFNSTTVPADTTVPIVTLKAKANDNFYWDAGKYPKYFSTGISISNSSTLNTKTIGSADCWFNVHYK